MADIKWRVADYALGPTVATYTYLRTVKVPPPDTVYSSPCEVEEQRGDGTWQRAGLRTVVWQWREITAPDLRKVIRAIFTSLTDASATGYVRTDLRAGYELEPAYFSDYACEVKRPRLDGTDGEPVQAATTVYRNVKLTFTLSA